MLPIERTVVWPGVIWGVQFCSRGGSPCFISRRLRVVGSPENARDFALSMKGVISRLGLNSCSLEPVTVAVTKPFHIQSIKYLSVPLHRAGEAWWGGRGGTLVDSAEVIIAPYIRTTIYILENAFTPIISSNSPVRWCHYLYVAVGN